jgi:putative ABC transport system ATP-binding protein
LPIIGRLHPGSEADSRKQTNQPVRSMNMIDAEHLVKAYRIGIRKIRVLNDVSLAVRSGEFIVVTGKSGSGKTTLLSVLSGLDKPTQGRVLINRRDITHAGEDELAPLRNQLIGFVFQSFHLVPSLTAVENIMFPAELQGDPQAYEKAVRLMLRVGLGDRLENFPHQLSGGEKQRVAMCRALINRPQLIFADEPTGNLDSENGSMVLQLLYGFQRELEATLILVTHNADIAQLADRVIVLKDGRIVNGKGI